MIKQIWTIRSVTKLFDGLTFAITLFMLGYTILNILVLPSEVSYKNISSGDIIAHYSKFILLILPVISTFICIVLHTIGTKVKNLIVNAKLTNRIIVGNLKIKYESLIGFNFILALTFFFTQLNLLNSAKEIAGFSPIIIVACIIGLIVFGIYQITRLIKAKQ